MAKQVRLRRRLAQIPIVPGSFATFDLPRDYDYGTLYMRITGSLTTTGATALRAESTARLVSRVEIVSDGKNTLFSAPFWAAAFANSDRRFSTLASAGQILVGPTATTNGTYPISCTGLVDFASIGAARPKDSNFRSSGLSLFQLRLTFGQPGDVIVGGTATLANGFVEVWADQTIEMPDAAGKVTTPLCLKKTSYQEIAITSNNPAQEIRLPAGNQIAQVLVRTEGGANSEPMLGVLNAAELRSGVDVRYSLTEAQIRASNAMAYGPIAPSPAYYALNIVENGGSRWTLSDLWDVSGVAEPKLVVDVTAGTNTKLQAVITEYIFATL